MTETRIKISSVIENQLPQFVKEEFPLVSEFLSQYYISLENVGGTSDILQNIDQYVKLDNLTGLIESTVLDLDVSFFDSTIKVKLDPENGIYGTAGFPDSYGLLLIDSEIITYTSKTQTTFDGCIRGFVGNTSYKIKDELTFTETQSEEHISGTEVVNLSILFLKEFLNKVKKQITPGFEDRKLYSELNERIFIKYAIDFYSSKGTDNSFKILFSALYGENVEVIRPRDYLIIPSDAQYRITSDLIVEAIEGNPENLINQTLYQDKDESNFINAAQGTITKVEKISRNSKNYYSISLDSDYNKDIQPTGSVYGKFTIQPKTKIVSNTILGSTTIEVDSTVSFPNKNGTLLVNLKNGTSLNITYSSKTLNQFLGCSGITQDIPESTEIKTDLYAYGYDPQGKIKVAVLGVLSDLKIPENTTLYSKDDTVRIKTLGIDAKDYKSNNWFFNIKTNYNVDSITKLGSNSNSYKINTFDLHSLRVGDSVDLISSNSTKRNGNVFLIDSEKSFGVKFDSDQFDLNEELDLNLQYNIVKNLSKVYSENYPNINNYTSNVQNVYLDDESLYVASPSLPTYLDRILRINDRSISFTGTFQPDDESDLTKGTTFNLKDNNGEDVFHGLYTGDSIVYKPSEENTLGIETGIYFIKKISDTQVKLSRSKNNIFKENFISVTASVTNAKFELLDFTYENLDTQVLESQKLIRKISNPENDGNVYDTKPGLTGIFINGVEILNYKSKDNVYYGAIDKIIPTSSGSGYDVINPPSLTISDTIGSGASGYCSVIGELERIDIIDPGFDYLENPIISISGGNGYGALAEANLVSFDHSVIFSSQESSSLVKLNPVNTIGFSSYHKFRDFEEVVYLTNNQQSIAGLSTNSTYFVSIQDSNNIKLHNSFSDSVLGINTIQITSFGKGNHILKSKIKKKKIGSVTIQNGGFNYQNKLTLASPIGINTSLDIIHIPDHGYQSGELITYNCTDVPIGGLSTSSSYYVTKISNDQFKLSQIGINTLGISTSFYYDTKQFIDLTSKGSGTHKFNYPDIKVFAVGNIGISTLVNQNFNAVLQPVFRGQIQSVFVESGGEKYGSEEIINFNRQPFFELNSGSGISLKPIIIEGKIVKVIINSSGSGYDSPPNIEVVGSGFGAVLVPILSNGSLVEVKIVNSGNGYDDNTAIIVTSPGNGAKFEAKIKSWKINLVERLLLNSKINEDDGILTNGLSSDYGLQYSHAYAPRDLRSSVQSTIFRDGEKIYIPDLEIDNAGVEMTPPLHSAHSPIIGWAYDGNPIYGPYGYSTRNGKNSTIKSLISGYEEDLKPDRPSEEIYPKGFFVEDYTYFGNGDLDIHNGRFCVTPEYPNGIYAYFTTIGDDKFNLFENYKKPSFPYIIGEFFKSKPIDFNFDPKSNQDLININDNNWKRNTTPYNLLSSNSNYEYIFNSNDIKQQNSIVRSTSKGSVDSIRILNAGNNYKVGDKIIFNDGQITKAKVSSIKGKTISQISVATSSFNDVIFYPYKNEFIGFTTVPHNYSNNDIITFTGKSDYKKSGTIKVNTNNLILTLDVDPTQYTGIVTYFSVVGNLNYPNIKENDIYQINDEQIKILNIDPLSSRIRVLRNQNGTSGLVTYTAGTNFTERTKKIVVNFGISTSYNFNVEKEFYFDPKESIGLGTSFGVGIVSTIYFSNPGVGITQITIPTQSIYLPNHNLITGDSLIYSSNGGERISISTDGISDTELENNSILYVARISNDLIGISTVKVGLNSIGTFVGIGTVESGILYFASVGTGNTHSFKTNYNNNLTGRIDRNVVTVTTSEDHELSLFDSIVLDVKSGISTSFVVKYDDYNRRLIVNPRIFSSINVIDSTITINNHNFHTGQKVIYKSNSPSLGLENNAMYYVVEVDPNKFKLSNNYYDSVKNFPKTIDILSTSSGTISPINPPIQIIKNQPVTFDLSDSSLGYFLGANNAYSAFKFKIYKDNLFVEEFDTSTSSTIFEVSEVGQVGIDSNAKVIINVSDSIPNNLYYNLIPINSKSNPEVKKEIVVDTEVLSSNKITFIDSEYNGQQKITVISSNSFKFNILQNPENNFLSPNLNSIEYYTNSTTSKGPIRQVTLTKKPNVYDILPGITSIKTEYGTGAILLPNTSTIGKILKTQIEDIGFDYSSDFSIRPTTKLPEILRVDPLSAFNYIGIASVGKNYIFAPNLIVIDGISNEIINDVILKYTLGDSIVSIIKNSSSISNVTPTIIPINNSNGIKIDDIEFDEFTKEVTVTLDAFFNDPEDFPFEIGSKVLIEGTSIKADPEGKGYNSSNYNYSLFTLTGINTALGGSGANITYNLGEYLKGSEIPGIYDNTYSSGKVIPESHFPIFDPVLKKNDFIEGESIIYYSPSSSSSKSTGIVESWDPFNQYLTISSIDDFEIGRFIIGESSGSIANIVEIQRFSTEYQVDSTSSNRKNWKKETGFLNNDFQRMHDNDYYQYFSYELKSRKDVSEWNNPVSTLNHASGFKKFGNLIVDSKPDISGIGSTEQNGGDFSAISDLSSIINLNCKSDFDLASENNFIIDDFINSNEIIFNSTIIQDYVESVGNNVLIIDNISEEFNSNPRPTDYSIVDSFALNQFRSKKYIAYIQDKFDENQSQMNIITLTHNNLDGYINQYGIKPQDDLGSFDFSISENIGNLLFYPVKTVVNDYNIQLFTFSLKDNMSGVGTLPLGDVVNINTSSSIVPQGTVLSTPIVSISSTYRSSKVLVQIGSTETNYYEYDEITYIHDENEVYLLDYGQLNTSTNDEKSSLGIGTYNAYIQGGNVQIDLIPYKEFDSDYNINTLNVSIGNTNSLGIGTQIVSGNSINSSVVSIASSSNPNANIIGTYSNEEFNGSYCIINIEDKTNLEYQISELLIVSDPINCYITQFGIIQTNSSLGIVTAGISTSETTIYFTPIEDIDVDVRLFKVDTGLNLGI